jgi:hypothetical protein
MISLDETLKELSPKEKQEVFDFIDFLKHKKQKLKKDKNSKNFSFKWAGGLEYLKDKYTSVELQHKVSDWMTK